MGSSYSELVQSKYFNSAFNGAIYDGPVRIYFAQFDEDLALELYFLIQQKYAETLLGLKEISRLRGRHILILMYPTEDMFYQFAPSDAVRWQKDILIGVKPAGNSIKFENIFTDLDKLLSDLLDQNSNISRELICE